MGVGVVPVAEPCRPNDWDPPAPIVEVQLTGCAVTVDPEALVVAPQALLTLTARS